MHCFSHQTIDHFQAEFYDTANQNTLPELLGSTAAHRVITFGDKHRLLADENPGAVVILLPDICNLQALLELCQSKHLDDSRHFIWGISSTTVNATTRLQLWLHPTPPFQARWIAINVCSQLDHHGGIRVVILPRNRAAAREKLRRTLPN